MPPSKQQPPNAMAAGLLRQAVQCVIYGRLESAIALARDAVNIMEQRDNPANQPTTPQVAPVAPNAGGVIQQTQPPVSVPTGATTDPAKTART